jgi:hypothetical protein
VRQTLQWQKYAGSGSALVGTVKDRCEVLQWHEAVSVVVSVIASWMLSLDQEDSLDCEMRELEDIVGKRVRGKREAGPH